jgi:phage terminase large subunit-like protein
MTADPYGLFARRIECEEDGLYFNRFFFKQRFGTKMIIGRHHSVTQTALDRTMLPPDHPDFISRLIINIPPGYTKTEQCSINYMARGLAINPMARFLHLSYSDKLVLLNSSTSREIVKSSEFQDMWPLVIKNDTDSKKIWHTDKNGGITATAAGGQVTGFRAGHMDYSKFSGALIIDDPVKPDDAYSETIRGAVNNAYNETIASRLAIESVPIIVVMQRIHWDDLSGYLLRGGSGEKWHHLSLPVIIDNSEAYPKEYTHGIPIDHGLSNGWLWPFKHNEKHEAALRAHRRKYQAQYKQSPIKRNEDTALWTDSLIARARSNVFDDVLATRTIVAVDPATTNNESSDEHGIVVASEYPGRKYSLDADYSRKGSPLTWGEAVMAAVKGHDADAVVIETNQGGDMCESNLRNAGYQGRIIRVHASKGKALRAEPVVSLYELGVVQHKGGMLKCEDEMLDFDPVTQKSDGKSPNRVDAAVYALTELAGVTGDIGQLLDMAIGGS